MYGKEYMEWREAQTFLEAFEYELDALDDPAREIVQRALQKRYQGNAVIDMGYLQRMQNAQACSLQSQFAQSKTPGMGLFGGIL